MVAQNQMRSVGTRSRLPRRGVVSVGILEFLDCCLIERWRGRGGWSAHPPASFSVPCTWSPHGSRPEIGATKGVARKAASLQRLETGRPRDDPPVFQWKLEPLLQRGLQLSLSRHLSCNTGDILGHPSQWLHFAIPYPVCLKAALLIRQRQTVTLSHCPRA